MVLRFLHNLLQDQPLMAPVWLELYLMVQIRNLIASNLRSDYKYPLSNIKFIGCTGLENSFDPQLNCFIVFNSDRECQNLKTLNQNCQSCLFSSNGVGLPPPKKFKYLLILLLFHLLGLFNRLRRWLSN